MIHESSNQIKLMNIIVEIAQESDEWDNIPYVNESLFSEMASIVLSRYPNFLKVKDSVFVANLLRLILFFK